MRNYATDEMFRGLLTIHEREPDGSFTKYEIIAGPYPKRGTALSVVNRETNLMDRINAELVREGLPSRYIYTKQVQRAKTVWEDA